MCCCNIHQLTVAIPDKVFRFISDLMQMNNFILNAFIFISDWLCIILWYENSNIFSSFFLDLAPETQTVLFHFCTATIPSVAARITAYRISHKLLETISFRCNPKEKGFLFNIDYDKNLTMKNNVTEIQHGKYFCVTNQLKWKNLFIHVMYVLHTGSLHKLKSIDLFSVTTIINVFFAIPGNTFL
jgi:hypothetical protein